MARPQLSPAAKSSVIINFKVRPAVKAAIDEIATLRGNEMGDGSTSGLMLALVFQEAQRRGVTIAPETKPETAAKPAKRAARKR